MGVSTRQQARLTRSVVDNVTQVLQQRCMSGSQSATLPGSVSVQPQAPLNQLAHKRMMRQREQQKGTLHSNAPSAGSLVLLHCSVRPILRPLTCLQGVIQRLGDVAIATEKVLLDTVLKQPALGVSAQCLEVLSLWQLQRCQDGG